MIWREDDERAGAFLVVRVPLAQHFSVSIRRAARQEQRPAADQTAVKNLKTYPRSNLIPWASGSSRE